MQERRILNSGPLPVKLGMTSRSHSHVDRPRIHEFHFVLALESREKLELCKVPLIEEHKAVDNNL